jgi:hypothetical protein
MKRSEKDWEGEKVELNKNEATNEKITNEELKFGFFFRSFKLKLPKKKVNT